MFNNFEASVSIGSNVQPTDLSWKSQSVQQEEQQQEDCETTGF